MITSDAKVRAEALDIHRSFIVEAPAGSGKTGLLIQRYMKLLLDEKVQDPSQVLAITFTVKATEEIRARVLEALHRAAQGVAAKDDFDAALLSLAKQVLDRDNKLHWQIVSQPDRMNIRTIDALAGQIARALPFFSSGLGTLQPVNDAWPLYRDAARRVLNAIGGEDQQLHSALRIVLLHRDNNLADVERLLSEMLMVREQWAAFVPLTDHALSDEDLEKNVRPLLDKALANELCARIRRADKLLSATTKQRILNIAKELCNDPGYDGQPNCLEAHWGGERKFPGVECDDLAAWVTLRRLFATKDGWRKQLTPRYLGIELSKYSKEQLKGLLDDLRENDELLAALLALEPAPPYPYPEDQWRVTKALFRLLRYALAQLQIVFAERSCCDFTEVAISARQALLNSDGANDLAAVLGTRLQHLLMDEMQDTSISQYELLELMTTGWDGASQTVFLVGDPKQSIYLFREARVGLFLRALRTERIGNVPLTRITLTANFRSQGKLVRQFNEIFGEIFVEGVKDSIVYSPAEPSIAETDSDLHWQLARKPYMPRPVPPAIATDIRKQHRNWESSTVADAVRAWRNRPHPEGKTWKIAVLVRNRKHAADIMQHLYVEGIPVRAVEIDALEERPEVLDLIALTRALIHPADRTAWLAVLHAPWCGLGSVDLHRIAAGDDVTRRYRSILAVAEERISSLADEPKQRAEQTLHVMLDALAQQGRMPFSQWIERTWRSLGGDSYLDKLEYANCLRYFAMLEELTQDGNTPSIEELESATSKLYAESNTEDAVEVLTIHKAKGLEWDLVIVPALERTTRSDTTPLLNWTEIEDENGIREGMLLAPIQSKGDEATHLNDYIASIKKKRTEAEIDRLFYVAATRARHSLHLISTATDLKGGEVKRARGSIMESAWKTVGPRFDHETTVRFAVTEQAESLSTAGNVVAFPSTGTSRQELVEIAASATRQETILRLPSTFHPRERFSSQPFYGQQPASTTAQQPIQRPQGSLVARALGDTSHVFLETVAKEDTFQQKSSGEMVQSIKDWQPRIANYARMQGLDDSQTKQVTGNVMRVLQTTLTSETGRWLLAPHPQADSERSFVIVPPAGIAEFMRVDRMFLAGETPLSTGEGYRWIVDFKTSERSIEIDAYLASEKAIYAEKMEAYATTANKTYMDNKPIMLALYYPLMDRLIYWPARKEN